MRRGGGGGAVGGPLGDADGHAALEETRRYATQRRLLVVALLMFLLIASGSVVCVFFGVTEIITNESTFMNDGLGEVLTVLGIYFALPCLLSVFGFVWVVYARIDRPAASGGAAAAAVAVAVVVAPRRGDGPAACATSPYHPFPAHRPGTEVPGGGGGGAARVTASSVLFSLAIALYLVQQALLGVYLYLMVRLYVNLLLVGDLGVLAALLYCWRRRQGRLAHAMVGYVLLLALKLAVLWGRADALAAVAPDAALASFGPNGLRVALWLSVIIIELPMLSTSTTAADIDRGDDEAPRPTPRGAAVGVGPTGSDVDGDGDDDAAVGGTGERTALLGREPPAAATGTDGGSARPTRLIENFTLNFNLFLLHLLHSLDTFEMVHLAFTDSGAAPVEGRWHHHQHPPTNATATTRTGVLLGAFRPPHGRATWRPPTVGSDPVPAPRVLPPPFKMSLAALVVLSFVGNNLSLIHLFYRRRHVEAAELRWLLPQSFRDATRHADDPHGAPPGRSRGPGSGATSHQRRIFQYMLFLLVICDVPMLVARLQLWLRSYSMLNIFVAKNIKSILDSVMMVIRADRSHERAARTRRSTAALPQDP